MKGRLAIALGLAISTHAYSAQIANMLLTNRWIHGHPNANSIAVAGGKILQVGNGEERDVIIDDSTNLIDLQGGKILKDEETGELLGILLDNAGDLVLELAWNSLRDQFEQSYQG
jgi:predicted amidohydrolase YtcJ